ncbi:hypothetical protein G9A89_000716 [Geosiphon pyriformis]|nr:hypothetical protein G9A89_000716 [Geosiphon pyriformis]
MGTQGSHRPYPSIYPKHRIYIIAHRGRELCCKVPDFATQSKYHCPILRLARSQCSWLYPPYYKDPRTCMTNTPNPPPHGSLPTNQALGWDLGSPHN